MPRKLSQSTQRRQLLLNCWWISGFLVISFIFAYLEFHYGPWFFTSAPRKPRAEFVNSSMTLQNQPFLCVSLTLAPFPLPSLCSLQRYVFICFFVDCIIQLLSHLKSLLEKKDGVDLNAYDPISQAPASHRDWAQWEVRNRGWPSAALEWTRWAWHWEITKEQRVPWCKKSWSDKCCFVRGLGRLTLPRRVEPGAGPHWATLLGLEASPHFQSWAIGGAGSLSAIGSSVALA